jgi:large subunit ribosomal protein L1
MPQRGKKYREAAKLIDRTKLYEPREAIELLKKIDFTKFDATVEAHIRTGVDPRHADQMVRGSVSLPAGTGRTVRVLVFAQGDKAREAEEAGADFVGGEDLVKRIQEGWTDFDVAIATQDMMGMVGRLGKVLGPRGLMPNPRSGTVTTDVGRTVGEVKAGRVEFRVDKTAVIHVPIGKASFTEDKLMQNLGALMDAVQRAKPTGAKGQYIRSVALATTMSPGVKLDLAPTLGLAAAAA